MGLATNCAGIICSESQKELELGQSDALSLSVWICSDW
jgi:hypothetical protein